MKIKLFGLILFLLPLHALAKKGFLFDIGEKLIKMDGFSYEELEKKNEHFLQTKNLCNQKTQPMSVSLENKNKKLIGCPLSKSYELYPNERDTGYNVVDLMQSGCRGIMKFKKEITKPNTPPEVTEYTTNIVALRDNTFRQLVLLRDKKRLFKPDSDFMDVSERRVDEIRLEYMLGDYRSGKLPTVVLGRIYDSQRNMENPRTGAQNSYILQYNVMENNEKKLEVTINGQSGNSGPNGNGTITTFEIYCTTKTLAELDDYAKNGSETKAIQELSKKVFGD